MVKDRNGRHEAWSDLKGRLASYKDLHKGRADKKGVLDKFLAARTLTQARKILRGEF